MQQEKKDLQGWISFLSIAEIPALKQTLRDLHALHQQGDLASALLLSFS